MGATTKNNIGEDSTEGQLDGGDGVNNSPIDQPNSYGPWMKAKKVFRGKKTPPCSETEALPNSQWKENITEERDVR